MPLGMQPTSHTLQVTDNLTKKEKRKIFGFVFQFFGIKLQVLNYNGFFKVLLII